MKFSIRFLLLLMLVAAAFFGGWSAKSNYDKMVVVDPLAHKITIAEGIVLSTKENLAAISVGSDDGIKRGALIDVYRQKQIIGTGKVVDVRNNLAAIEMIDDTLSQLPQEGDIAIANR